MLPVVACDKNSPTEPTGPQVPTVAGNYTGPVTLTVSGGSVSGTGRMEVAQAGDQLTITGSITLGGQTIQIPAVTGTLNATGFFTIAAGSTVVDTIQDQTCGTMRASRSTLTFSGRTARYVEELTTTRCGPVPTLRHAHQVTPGPWCTDGGYARSSSSFS